jgi:hypothetical protein
MEGAAKELMLLFWNAAEETLVNQITRITLESTNTSYVADKDYLMIQVMATLFNQHVGEILEANNGKKTPKQKKDF